MRLDGCVREELAQRRFGTRREVQGCESIRANGRFCDEEIGSRKRFGDPLEERRCLRTVGQVCGKARGAVQRMGLGGHLDRELPGADIRQFAVPVV